VRPVRQSEREYHTRFGWWLMTHDRGGAAVIGIGAALVLAADVLYASSRWSGAFPRSFLLTFGGIAVCIAVAFALRLNRPIGADRRRARWNQRGVNVALVIVIVAFIEIGNHVGGDGAGLVLGALAGVASLFICATLAEFVRGRPRWLIGKSRPWP
jgi:hypothetical protein